jgi:hypothetical protein
MFDGLPVLFVDSYEDITESMLWDRLRELQQNKYNLNRLLQQTRFEEIRS